ncbi:hypothetical protein ND856_18655 [Leptospira bandrabouensis]|uniref:hypothetical protein n=1 Tax=Leptospira bandrabouensis TaxID=2484903 RepID=UPI00223D3D3B|nr:hypothetical protein [Leptospira bandrabouensis]MCW7460155.1 hypothetical protein [Leptospira bandrabouensis]MCW7479328.1 hypothetical protein [Leptospira bandrabouensis]MCW7487010.1 hypothetical protein [Leptospira bandrabouensis]
MSIYEDQKVEFKLTLLDNDGAEITSPPGKLMEFNLDAYVESSTKLFPLKSSGNENSAVGEEVKATWFILFDEKKIPSNVNLTEGWQIKVPKSTKFYSFLDICFPSGRYARKIEIFV